MIYTCTLNPAVDFYVQVPEFSTGRINQGELLRFVPGGKGLNVSMVLKQLGVENIALGFVGGKFGKLLQELLIEYNITTDFVEIKGETRLNVKIRDELETDINLVGPEVTKSEVDKLLSKLDIINPNDYLVVGGKAPKTSESIISMIGSYAKKKDLNLIVDMSGNDLVTMLNYQPLLIKPNKEELETLIKRKLDNLSEIETVCKYLINKYHITYVLVSLGKDGAILVSKDESIYEKAPIGKVINTVGAGDALLAGFLASYTKSPDLKAALQQGIKCASKVVFTGYI